MARWKRKTPTGRTSDEERRRRFACPSQRGTFDDIDLSFLDPADPDDRHMLILAEHPEFAEAIERDNDEVLVGDEAVNPRLHITMHEIVATQLWENDPPEVWATAKRLLAAGYERHDVLHMLGSALMGEIWTVLKDPESPHDRTRYTRRLEELPESWHRLAETE